MSISGWCVAISQAVPASTELLAQAGARGENLGSINLVMQTIDLHVQRFFVQALQLDPLQLRLEAT